MADSARFKFHPDAIGHVLADRLLTVPVYQRSYSWGSEQINDFWTDLSGAFDEGGAEYFLGNLVLSAGRNNGNYTIIDGQQRLSTTLNLLAAIRDEFRKRGDDKRANIIENTHMVTADLDTGEDVPRLRMNSDDNPFFRLVVVEGKEPKQEDILHGSHVLIHRALKELSTLVGASADSAGKEWARRLTDWTKFLKENVQVIVVDVPTEADAFLIFETLNDRGADLTIADLLKNYLFGRAGEDLDTVRDGWMAALGALEMSAENSVFTAFLRHLWSSKYGATRERLLFKNIRQRITSQVHAVEFSQELKLSARNYAAILNSEHEAWANLSTGAKANLDTLSRLDLEQMRPLLLAAMQHLSDRELKRTLRALVSWGVRGLIVGGIGGGKTERAYCQAAVKVRSGSIKTANELLSELSEIIPTDEEFKASFAKARVTKGKLARYYLTALEDTEEGETEPELVPNEDEEKLNLEHVLPQNPKGSDWNQFSEEEQKIWVHRLGNMTLLQKGPNGRIGNKPWVAKKPVLKKSKLALTNHAGQEDEWSKEVIDKRQQELASLATKTWPRKP